MLYFKRKVTSRRFLVRIPVDLALASAEGSLLINIAQVCVEIDMRPYLLARYLCLFINRIFNLTTEHL